MNQNLQSGMHPDPDQLSIFMEGTATAKEHERMLAEVEKLMDKGERRTAEEDAAGTIWLNEAPRFTDPILRKLRNTET